MNFGKLLGSGKTFFGGGSGVAYRENKRVYLPKFNTEKNPFAPKPVEPAPTAVAPEVKKVSAPLAAKPLAVQSQTIPAPAVAGPTRAVNWKEKLNPFRAPAPTRVAPQDAVQVELSLDAVKVVHNDLADADIEVVPVKSRTAAAPETPARASWDFLGERLVKQI